MKKILSIALAAIMLFSVCAISVNAIDYTDGQRIGYRVVTDATVGQAAGTTVNVSVYYDLPDGFDTANVLMLPNNIYIAYNDSLLTYVSRTWGPTMATFMKPAANVTNTPTLWTSVSGAMTVEDAARGYTNGLLVQQAVDSTNGVGITAQSGFTIVTNEPIFTLAFTADATITDAVLAGMLVSTIGKQTVCKVKDNGVNTTLTAANVNLDEATGITATASGPTVTTTDPQVQWQDAANGKMKMGFTGKIAGFTPEYSSGVELSNITACGVIYSTDSAATLEVGAANTNNVSCYTIYGAATGTDFTFRAIMSDVPYEGTGAMYFRAYIVYNGTTIYGAADSTTANAEYLEGVTAGLAAFGA